MSGFALVKRVLGVDHGQARIGLAISDELGMLAHPLETVPAKPIDAAAKRIAQLARGEGCPGCRSSACRGT
jgi:RNase H-fold protein (predicted Holliday junction resolvase)